MEDMSVSKSKAIKCLSELEQIGLVEKKQRGLGLPSLIFVKDFVLNVPEVSI